MQVTARVEGRSGIEKNRRIAPSPKGSDRRASIGSFCRSQSLAFSVPKILKKTRFESQRYLRERDHEAGRIACRRRTDHGRNDGRSDRWWLFLSYTYFSPRPSSGGNLFDLRPRRIAFGSPSSARPPPCSCGGATWAGYLDNPLFVSYIT